MAISYVGSASADATTVTIPAGHQAGDLIIILSSNSTTTAPTLPAGWTSISSSTTAPAFRSGYKFATSGAETSGTWTNATGLICMVYRGVTQTFPVVTQLSTNIGTSATVTYSGPITIPPGNWIVAFAIATSTTSTIETPPAGLTMRTNTVGAALEYVGFDSNGIYPNDRFPSTNVGITVSNAWRENIVVIAQLPLAMQNYMGFKAGNGMSTGEKIR